MRNFSDFLNLTRVKIEHIKFGIPFGLLVFGMLPSLEANILEGFTQSQIPKGFMQKPTCESFNQIQHVKFNTQSLYAKLTHKSFT